MRCRHEWSRLPEADSEDGFVLLYRCRSCAFLGAVSDRWGRPGRPRNIRSKVVEDIDPGNVPRQASNPTPNTFAYKDAAENAAIRNAAAISAWRAIEHGSTKAREAFLDAHLSEMRGT